MKYVYSLTSSFSTTLYKDKTRPRAFWEANAYSNSVHEVHVVIGRELEVANSVSGDIRPVPTPALCTPWSRASAGNNLRAFFGITTLPEGS